MLHHLYQKCTVTSHGVSKLTSSSPNRSSAALDFGFDMALDWNNSSSLSSSRGAAISALALAFEEAANTQR